MKLSLNPYSGEESAVAVFEQPDLPRGTDNSPKQGVANLTMARRNADLEHPKRDKVRRVPGLKSVPNAKSRYSTVGACPGLGSGT